MRRIQLAGTALAVLLLAGQAQAQGASAPAAAPTVAPAPVAAPAAPVTPAAGGEQGKIAWYGAKFNGRKTACGQRFDAGALTMAHKTLACGTRVKVTNLKTNRSVVLRVTDRGPSSADRVGDVSRAAAARLRMLRSGVVEARFDVVAAAPARARRK